jgi:excisionase family DNA binding protein
MASIADQHGPFLRVDEAALVLRISRTSAYAQARLWLESGGTDGLPAVRIGRSVRIPAVALDRLADTGQLDTVAPVVVPLRDAG